MQSNGFTQKNQGGPLFNSQHPPTGLKRGGKAVAELKSLVTSTPSGASSVKKKFVPIRQIRVFIPA
jgi:hypothetical protein